VFLFAVGGLLGLILLVIWVLTIADIVRSHLGAAKTWAWILIVIILPFLGALLYWFVLRQPTEGEVQRQIDNERAMRESAHSAPFDSTSIRP
jgi:cardiolipin synthase A/B